jgi:DNA replication protein DnaC
MKPISEVLKNLSIPRNATPDDARVNSDDADVCPYCKGAGFVRVDAPVNSPNFSRLFPCICKREERWQRTTAELRAYSNMELVRDLTFERFDPDIKGARDAYEMAWQYARDPYNWIVFHGPYGSGKTHLAAAIANYAQTALNMGPVFTVVPDLLDYLRSTFAPDSDVSYEKRFEAIRSSDLLVLDDLGTENTTPWAKEKLFQIVNHRYMERLPTIFTTNVDLKDELDGRVRSRISDVNLSSLVYINSPDYRLRGLPPQPRRK